MKKLLIMLSILAIFIVGCTQAEDTNAQVIIADSHIETEDTQIPVETIKQTVTVTNNQLDVYEVIVPTHAIGELVFVNRESQTQRLSILALNVDVFLVQNEEYSVAIQTVSESQTIEFEFANHIGTIIRN